ncbi:hypothetical protein N7E02_25310 [Aliirhizobium terrae]|uniref:hypothetical protein n=1 Tax=Terrirhizobium terrae TaxID=2926709 RepID=UPI0025749EA1|nr:hypothetical protein [Rhizobium sp. CC-CFT758]WJH39959.1 hypothetical protein N7E02_25310 [Rhizobium sp. CC-CFT758]
MGSKHSLAKADIIFAVLACVFAVVLFQSSAFGELCQGVYRFQSLPAFNAIPMQIWMKIGVLTALIIPGIAAWSFRHRRDIFVPALAVALLLLIQIGIEAAFALSGQIHKIAVVGAVFSIWRAIRLVQLGISTGKTSLTWRVVFFLCALQWTINLCFLIVVLSRNCTLS